MENLCERDKAVLRSIFDPTVTIGDIADDSDHFLQEDDAPSTDAERQSVALSARGVTVAEAGNLEEALSLMSQAVQLAPERAAGYNDRAQLLRLMFRDDEAMSDIERALALTAGKKTRARAQALCQKGVLLRKAGQADEARACFSTAAKMGSSFARKQVVELNPYAALCNQMLSQVLKGEKEIKL